MVTQTSERKDERVVILCEKSYVDRLNDLAKREYFGKRSILIREALDDLLSRKQAVDHDSQSTSAA